MPNLFEHPLATSTWESLPAFPALLSTRATWVTDSPEEAPRHRVIHAKALLAPQPFRVDTLRLHSGAGYHKCASGPETDGVRRLVLRVPDGLGWRVVEDLQVDPDRAMRDGLQVPLDGLRTTAIVAEIREAVTDRWWPGWNLAQTGISLDGTIDAPWSPQLEGALALDHVNVGDPPPGVTARVHNGQVTYDTPHLRIGFRLRSPSLSHLGIDSDGKGATERNLLQMPRSMDIVRSGVYPSGVYPVLRDQNSEYLTNGPRMTRHDGFSALGFLSRGFAGSVSVTGSTVTYDIEIPEAHTCYRLTFTIQAESFSLRAQRRTSRDQRAWWSSAWHLPMDNRVAPSSLLGNPTRVGETGLLAGDAIWHFPRHGTLDVSVSGSAQLRTDSVRPLDTNTFELKLGEVPQVEGDYLLPAGEFNGSVEFAISRLTRGLVGTAAPPEVARAVERHVLSGLPFRPDTSTISNNAASMHCTGSFFEVARIAAELPATIGPVEPMQFIGLSLDRWLNGAPSYGGGPTSHGTHRLDDEYVHMSALTLGALGHFLRTDSGSWFAERRDSIVAATTEMLARDLDGDGLVESAIRRGVSGEHQWSTAWADIISFGWKDAWANAALYEAWRVLGPELDRLGESELARRIDEAAGLMQANYVGVFLNPDTGIVAGWRSADGTLHDYGFSVVNGAACGTDLIDMDQARSIMQHLVKHWRDADIPPLSNGLPLNLWRVPEYDLGGVVFGLPMGGYQQGGCSHHHARLVVDALERAGLTEEAHALLIGLCETIADDTAMGGLGSGVDWRMWDGTPSGYEGQLGEGFGVLATALRWYRSDQASNRSPEISISGAKPKGASFNV